MGQVVFGYRDVLLADDAAFPCGQSHVFLTGIRSGEDQLCGSLLGDGIKQFILGFGKKHLSGFVRAVVVAAQGKKVT